MHCVSIANAQKDAVETQCIASLNQLLRVTVTGKQMTGGQLTVEQPAETAVVNTVVSQVGLSKSRTLIL
jgi:hypothetical protein